MAKFLALGGAKPGIGQALTTHLLEAGHEVVATYEPESLSEFEGFIEKHTQVEWMELDSRLEPSVANTLDAVTDIDAVIVAEFYFYMEDRGYFDIEQWNRSLRVNLTLPKLIGHLVQSRWKSCRTVVFVTSSEANSGSFGAHGYAATKAAVHNLTKSLANTASGACRFNSLAAGWIGGVMDTDEVFNMSRKVTPLGRLGSPEEIAEVALWLSSTTSSFVNGTTVTADGGYTGVDTISRYEFEAEFGEIKA